MNARVIISGLILVAVIASFVAKRSRSGPGGVTQFSQSDAGMTAAIAQARGSVDQFVARLGKPVSPADLLSVKIPLATTNGGHEHIWCDNVSFAGGVFTANIANDPMDRRYKLGQKVSAAKAEISDWMYVQDGRLVGGYTLRYMVSQMSVTEREEFKRSVPFKLE